MHGRVRGRRTTRKRTSLAAVVCATSILTIVSGALGSGDQRQGGILRIAIADLDYVDPALSYTGGGWAIIDTTCARLMTYPDKPAPEGLRLVPEVAVGLSEDLTQRQDVHVQSCGKASDSATAHRFMPAPSHERSIARSHLAWRRQAERTPRTSWAPPTSCPARPRRRVGSRHRATRSSFASHAPSPTSRQ